MPVYSLKAPFDRFFEQTFAISTNVGNLLKAILLLPRKKQFMLLLTACMHRYLLFFVCKTTTNGKLVIGTLITAEGIYLPDQFTTLTKRMENTLRIYSHLLKKRFICLKVISSTSMIAPCLNISSKPCLTGVCSSPQSIISLELLYRYPLFLT